MDKELQKWYEDQFDMMSRQGWVDLIEKISEIKATANDLSTVADAQQLHFRQGQLDILDLMLNRKRTCEEVYEQLQGEPV